MKLLVTITFVFLHLTIAHGANVVKKNSAGEAEELRVDLKLEVLERNSNGELSIRATGSWEEILVEFCLVSRPRSGSGERPLPGGPLSAGFRSDMEVQNQGKASESLLRVVQKIFRIEDSETFFRGFESFSFTNPRHLERDLSVSYLGDPAIEGKRDWRLACFIDPRTRQITLYVSRPALRE